MKSVVFIESNTSGTGAVLVRKALERGLLVHFLASNASRYGFLASEMVHPVVVDTSDPRAVLEAVRGLSGVAAVLSSSEYYVETAAVVARELGLFGADPDAIRRCRDKWKLFQCLTEARVRVPATARITDRASAAAALHKLGLPLVVKPVSGSGSIDVRLHREEGEFLDHVQRLLGRTANERGQSVAPVVLAQSFVDGAEFSVEVLGHERGLEVFGVTKKHLGPEPMFLEVGHDFPAALDEVTQRALVDETRQALRAVGLTSGPAHVELRLGPEGPVVIEINPRFAGGMIPSLLQHALGLDVLDLLLDVSLGEQHGRSATRRHAASIAQIVPPHAGVVDAVVLPEVGSSPGIVGAWATKGRGHLHRATGDFRDRIGHVISRGADTLESRAALQAYLEGVQVKMRPTQGLPALIEDTGRVGQSLSDAAMAIVRRPKPQPVRLRTFQMMARVDQAHVLMLMDCGCLGRQDARAIVSHVRELEREGFASLLVEDEPRGPYLLYESAAIDRLGVEVGGAAHLGRSRNDINATLFRLRLREDVVGIAQTLWSLRSTLLQCAARSTELLMPLYSQYQPGTPSTLAAYWLAVEEALSRDQRALEGLFGWLDESPMGACAGGGTSVPIDPQLTATLLGFSAPCRSSIDGVASRDLAVRLASAVAMCGVNVSRVAQDLQLWSTREFDFIELPDGLVGGSSNMPQKRNPYLLEIIKGRAAMPAGHLANMLSGMSGVPFGNSVQAGTEAVSGLSDALGQVRDAVSLCALVVDAVRARPAAMRRACDHGLVEAIAVVETLVRERGVGFRSAHHEVGAVVRRCLANGDDASKALRDLLPVSYRDHDASRWVRGFDFGGGPGQKTTARNLGSAAERLRRDADVLRAAVATWEGAEVLRRMRIQELIDG